MKKAVERGLLGFGWVDSGRAAAGNCDLSGPRSALGRHTSSTRTSTPTHTNPRRTVERSQNVMVLQ
jgi:hypothetical protein